MSLFKTWAVFVKESRHIARDLSTLLLLLFAPVFLMVVMSYMLIADIRQTPITVMDNSNSVLSRQLLQMLTNNSDVVVDKVATTYANAEQYFDRNQTKALVVIPPNFAAQLTAGKPTQIQLIVDGTDPNTASHVIVHVMNRAQMFGMQVAIETIERTRPELISFLEEATDIDLRIRTVCGTGGEK